MSTVFRIAMATLACVFGANAFAALGTSAAMDQRGQLWMAYAEQDGGAANVRVARFDAPSEKWLPSVLVNATPEPVSSDGENRPKLAFGPENEIYVSWTSPTSAKYTGDIRFARSLDGGKTWKAPTTIHSDRQRIAHRFESLIVDRSGRLWATWIDKRDLRRAEQSNSPYAGAAVYFAYSDDRGASWQGDFKLADNSCECCRIALALDARGQPAAMWRHVFEPNERDHAFASLSPEGGTKPTRVTFDRWAIDACPHHGPSLAIANDGTRHAVWFTQRDGKGRVFYGQLGDPGPTNVRELPAGASHADIAVDSDSLAIAWKRFDGETTRVETWLSHDAGKSFVPGPVLRTAVESDQPRVVAARGRTYLLWRQADKTSVTLLGQRRLSTEATHAPAAAGVSSRVQAVRPFERKTLGAIEREHEGEPFWLILWDLECTYCVKSLQHAAEAQKRRPGLRIVTIATDPVREGPALSKRLALLGLRGDAFAFANAPTEALSYAVDPTWAGEKPRAYRYDASGKRQSFSGVLSVEQLLEGGSD